MFAAATLFLASAFAAPAAPAAPPADPLQPLAFLVGHCWAGDFPNGMGRDTHCYEAMYGGKFVRDRHVLHGKEGDYAGETIYGYDPGRKAITYWYFSSDGDIDSSTVLPVADGFDFPERTLTQPQNVTMRTRWRHTAADRYESHNERKAADGKWVTEWKVLYVRSDADKK